VRFWYQAPSGSAPPFRAIASTYLWGWVLVNEEMPHLTGQEAETIDPDSRLVLLINRQAEADDARTALGRSGFGYTVIAHQTFDSGGHPFTVLIADLFRVRPE
jgi:hypothetical protein